jgi:sigma-B regulation protein RsbU (phosphoserine phosphatase)
VLSLKDFVHLPQLDPLVRQLASDAPGLIVVAGLDTPAASGGDLPLPSGRAALLRMLLWEILDVNPAARATVVSDDEALVRVPRGLRGRVRRWIGEPAQQLPERILSAAGSRPDVLVVDQLGAATAAAVSAAARAGVRTLTQIDTIFRGAGVLWHLRDLGLAPEQLGALTWVVAVKRLPLLCTTCRAPLMLDEGRAARIAQLLRRAGHEPAAHEAQYYAAPGCAECVQSGRRGDIAAFDILRIEGAGSSALAQPSLLPLEVYALELAAQGYVAIDDVLELEHDQLRHTYRLFSTSAQALGESERALRQKIAQLEAANRVLNRRTEALMSLEAIAQALAGAASLNEMAQRVCRHARELCGADRAALYLFLNDNTAEVLAVSGWSANLVGHTLPMSKEFAIDGLHEPAPFKGWPPGVPERHADVEGGALRAGLRVPLLANEVPFGLMIVHSIRKARFQPGEIALLQTFANHVALSIQQSWLIFQLQEKVNALEAAQAALVAKERIERELELARQVQQSVLPQVFPQAAGYTFAARSRPARRVGGDLYDVIDLGDERIGLMIADVSDKGMPAALYMALVRSLILAEAQREPMPRAVLESVNRLLRRLGDPHMFVTVFYGVIDLAARQLTFCRAGHDYPLLLRAGAVEQLGGHGTVLGMFEQGMLSLSEETLELRAGDLLVLYTDGLTDVLNPAGQRFDLARLAELCRSFAHLAPEAFRDALFAALDAYQGEAEQYDDMTLLVMGVCTGEAG